MLIAFLFWGYVLPKIESFGIDSIKILKVGLPISYAVLFTIIYLGQKAGATLFAFYILASIVISLTQPAIALTFAKNFAGKALTSFNVFLFSGTFFMQWGIGLIIDFCTYLGFERVFSYQVSFFCFLLLCIPLTYLHISPFPMVSYYLNHSTSNYDVALKKSLCYKNSLMYHVKGLSEKIR